MRDLFSFWAIPFYSGLTILFMDKEHFVVNAKAPTDFSVISLLVLDSLEFLPLKKRTVSKKSVVVGNHAFASYSQILKQSFKINKIESIYYLTSRVLTYYCKTESHVS